MAAERETEGKSPGPMNYAMREMTVGEYLDQAIYDAQMRVDGLRELRDSLPSGYLHQGCSKIAQALRFTK